MNPTVKSRKFVPSVVIPPALQVMILIEKVVEIKMLSSFSAFVEVMVFYTRFLTMT